MGSLVVKYTELLSLSVEQLFYQNRICRQYKTEPILDMSIVPTEECIRLMKRLDMIFKSADTKGGFTVAVRVAEKNGMGNNQVQFSPRKGDKLTFLILLKNAEALSFSDLPVQTAADSVYYFTNQITDGAAKRSNLHVTKHSTGVHGADDLIKEVTDTYHFHHPAVVVPGTAIVKHLLTGATKMPSMLTNGVAEADLTFDLSSFSSGKCQLLINNVMTDEFYYSGPVAHRVLGFIELSLSSVLPVNYRVIEPDGSLTAQRPVYKIQLNSRRTRWRYTVQLQSNSPLYLEIAALSPADKTDFIKRLNIECNDTNITFKRTSASDTVFEFVSEKGVILQEKYISSTSATHDSLSLTLKKYIGNMAKEAAVKTDMPYPHPGALDASHPPLIYSNIFLTI